MSKLLKAVLFSTCFIAAGAANAQLGGLGGMMGGNKAASGGDISADVTTFVAQSGALSSSAAQSVLAINSAFMSETERAKARADWESSEKMTNAKEKQAKQAELIESGTANLTRMVEGGKLEAEMKALDAAKKKMVGTALTNFAIGGLQAVGLTKTGQSIIQKAGSNPMNLTKIGPVKDALPILAKVMKDSGGLMAGLVKVAKGANIEIAAVKEDSKPTSFTF